jgi:predicted O-methyltransferase YrrM
MLRLATDMVSLSLETLLARSDEHLVDYLRLTEGLSQEPKGIRRSEMFFLYVAVADLEPTRIIESGRARAQSTLVLSSLFPDASIISVEFDAASADVAVAAERLKGRRNIECRFGDSRLLLPQLLRRRDVIVIDGPKDFRALKLALRLLRTGKPAAVFVHDLWLGSPARRFVERSVKTAFLSDHPEWVRRYSALDSRSRKAPVSLGDTRWAYGATLGCFPPGGEDYTRCLLQCGVAQATERSREIWRKAWGGPARVRAKDFASVSD